MVPVIAVPYLSRIPSLPPRGVSTAGLVEVITTTVESRAATNSWSYPDYLDLRHAETGMTLLGWASAPSEITLPTGGKVTTYPLYVSDDYFPTLGVKLARGTGFDGQTKLAVVVSYQFWQNDLGGDPAILGKTLKLDKLPYVVTGVAPEGFEGHMGLQGKSLFVPLERFPLLVQDDKAGLDRGKEWLFLHGRLANGVGVAQANAAVERVTGQMAKDHPATNKLKAGSVVAYDPMGFGRSQFRRLQALALTLTGAVLFVVCLNLSGMMQVRSARRERELSIRQAVGATRFRLARHLLAEAVLLAGAGGLVALLVLANAPAVISQLASQPIPAQFQEALTVDFSMVAICGGLCLVTSLAFGFLPAMRYSRPVIISALKDEAGAGGMRVGRAHRYTAALQVAIAVPLLVLGGISLDRVRSTAIAKLGFDADRVFAAPLELEAGPENGDAAKVDFRIRSLREDLANSAGIASATVADGLPLDFRARGATVSLPSAAATQWRVHVTRVGDGYLHTMGIPLLSGRGFGQEDRLGSTPVTIISKALADRLFPQSGVGEAIGKRLTFGASGASGDRPTQPLTVIGVTGDFPTSQMSAERAQLLLPLGQLETVRPKSISTDERGRRLPDLLLIARAGAGEQPEKIMASLQNVVRQLEPEFRRDRIVTGASLRKRSVDDFLTQSAVAGVTGGVVLILSALGIYGVVGLMVVTRTREIAVRIALGASRARVVSLILLDVVRLTAPGVALGLLLTAVLVHLNGENMGIPLSSVEPLAYVVGGAIAIGVAVVAGLVPARRAASVLPMVAMRAE